MSYFYWITALGFALCLAVVLSAAKESCSRKD